MIFVIAILRLDDEKLDELGMQNACSYSALVQQRAGFIQPRNLFQRLPHNLAKYGPTSVSHDEIVWAGPTRELTRRVQLRASACNDTPLAERGGSMSTITKERIAIAPELVRNPKVLMTEKKYDSTGRRAVCYL